MGNNTKPRRIGDITIRPPRPSRIRVPGALSPPRSRRPWPEPDPATPGPGFSTRVPHRLGAIRIARSTDFQGRKGELVGTGLGDIGFPCQRSGKLFGRDISLVV